MNKTEAESIFARLGCEPYRSTYTTGWRVFVDGHYNGQYVELEIRHGPRLFFGGQQLPILAADYPGVMRKIIAGLD
jgi:hypothetical protein